MTYVCGTGSWTGPKPGDPDNNSVLSAVGVFGGIDVRFTYPGVNPHAVALVKLYRGIVNQFDGALQIHVMNGDYYFDRVASGVTYYYWIQIVSVNGTEAEVIGPASAQALPQIDEMITLLTGKIDAGVLAATLRNEINRIPITADEVQQEIADRAAGDAALSTALAQVNAGVQDSLAFIATERTQRMNGQTALAEQIDAIVAVNSSGAAALVETERLARVAADDALAQQIDSVQTVLGEDVAGVQTLMQAQISAVNGKVNQIGALYTVRVNVNGLIGGFGVYNDGSTVEAGFDVDTFWIGRTNADKRKPFIISDGVVYIDEGAISHLTFNKLRDDTGTFLVQDGKIKAEFLDTEGIVVRDDQGNPIFTSGGQLDWSRLINRPKIGAANISTWMDGAAIGTAYIQNLAVKNAQLDNASVSTLKIQGFAVTVPVTAVLGSLVAIGYAWTDVLEAAISFPDEAPQSVIVMSSLNLQPLSAGTATAIFRLIRDGGPELMQSGVTINGAHSNNLVGVDAPGVGTFTYRLQCYLVAGATCPVAANSAALVLLGGKR